MEGRCSAAERRSCSQPQTLFTQTHACQCEVSKGKATDLTYSYLGFSLVLCRRQKSRAHPTASPDARTFAAALGRTARRPSFALPPRHDLHSRDLTSFN